MEDVKEFQIWLHQLLKDAREKLEIIDETMVDVLLREALAIYAKARTKQKKNG